MSKTSGIHHIAMNVSEMTRSITFYETAFGFSRIRSWKEGKAAMLDMGDGTILELFERPEAAGQVGSLLHIALRTNDVDGAYARALEAGAVEQTAPKDVDIPAEEPFPVRIAFVQGPDGESVELFHER